MINYPEYVINHTNNENNIPERTEYMEWVVNKYIHQLDEWKRTVI